MKVKQKLLTSQIFCRFSCGVICWRAFIEEHTYLEKNLLRNKRNRMHMKIFSDFIFVAVFVIETPVRSLIFGEFIMKRKNNPTIMQVFKEALSFSDVRTGSLLCKLRLEQKLKLCKGLTSVCIYATDVHTRAYSKISNLKSSPLCHQIVMQITKLLIASQTVWL